MRIERLDPDVTSQWVRVCMVQLDFAPQLDTSSKEFGWHLSSTDKPHIEKKIFSALDLARFNSANIICFPELCFSREWAEQVKTEYADMIVIGGSYYQGGYNICPVMAQGKDYLIRKINPSPNTEGEVEPGRGMKCGDEIVIFHTKYGKFAVLICLDYREEAHKILKSSDENVRNIDFIFNPSYNADIVNFQERANQDCQMGNYPYIVQVNGAGQGSCIICMDHNAALERYKLEGYKELNDTIKYKFLQAKGEMAVIADLDIQRKGVPVPAAGLKMKIRGWHRYENGAWRVLKTGRKHIEPGSGEAIASTKGERKKITALYILLPNLSAFSEKLDPEEIHAMVNEFSNIVKGRIETYGGTFNRFIGDGALALFGVPRTLEDAPHRALKAALDISDCVTSFNKEKRLPAPLEITIGINTGTEVTGMPFNGKGFDSSYSGEAVRLAGNIARFTEQGSIQVAEPTFRLTEGFFKFGGPAAMRVNGKTPINVYPLQGLSGAKTRVAASLTKGLTPLVGRGPEMGILKACFEKASEGRGQVVGVVGEPGIGKSRLVHEFVQSLPEGMYRVLEGRCVYYGDSSTYLPFVEIVKECFQIGDSKDIAATKEKIGGEIAGFRDLTYITPPLHELLSLPVDDEKYPRLDPTIKKQKLFDAIRLLLTAESQAKPLVIVVEDLHWIDNASQELVSFLISGIADARIMLILLYRPEYIPVWLGKSYCSQIRVDQLSKNMRLNLVHAIFTGAEVEEKLNNIIVAKTAGNPLFTEELCRGLVESGSIRITNNRYEICGDPSALPLPDTIQGIIAARLDRLDKDLKDVIQRASVLGREFSLRVLESIASSKDEVKSALSTLQDHEFIYEKTLVSEPEYIFKHALTRDVAYYSVLLKIRKEIHEQAGLALEQIYADRPGEYYETLGHHFYMSEKFDKAAEYYRLAGKKAQKIHALSDSVIIARKRVACLEKLPLTDELQAKIIDARTKLGLYVNWLNHFAESYEAVEPFFEAAEKMGLKRQLGQMYLIRGTYFMFVTEDLQPAIRDFEHAMEIAQETKDFLTIFQSKYFLGMAFSWCCEFDKGIAYFQEMINICSSIKNLYFLSDNMSMLVWHSYNNQGRLNEGYEMAAKAIHIAEESGNSFSRGAAYAALGIIYHGKGIFDEAEKHLRKAIENMEVIDEYAIRSNALIYLGEIYFEKKEYSRSIDYLKAAIQLLEKAKAHPNSLAWVKICLMRSRIMNGDRDLDVEDIYSYFQDIKAKVSLWLGCYIGDILLNIDNLHFAEAEQWIKKAIEHCRGNGIHLILGRCHAFLADLFMRKGDLPQARENLVTAIDIFKECGADGWVGKYEKELAALT